LPSREELGRLVAAALEAQAAEGPQLRPRDASGLPGGLLLLHSLPTVLVPDLHGRAPFLRAVLGWTPPGAKGALRELLAAGEAQLLCLGDLFHTEVGSAPRRWREALREYLSGWAERRAMDEEMALCLAAARAVLECKIAYPASFHCLKGNHDNIADEEGHGDHPFYKFAAEGEMVASWFEAAYGRELLDAYRRFELGLPVLAAGERFVASHAEPAFALGPEDAIEYRSRPDVVEALIWTANDAAAPGSVAASMARILAARDGAAGLAAEGASRGTLWFGGHRPVDGRYALRAGGLYVQFHDPAAWRVAYLLPGRDPDPDRDILDVS
jgi:hypothetical protein